MKDINKIGGIGASEVGALFTRDGIRSRTAKTLALEKAKELITGEKKQLNSKELQHGILNEFEAFKNCISPIKPNAEIQSYISYSICDSLWATPDVIDTDCVIDIKCPYTIYTYYQNINKIKKYYQYQVNTQMIATKKDKGFLCYYLTAHIDENGYKEEYKIPLSERFKFVEVEKIEGFEKELIKRHSEFIELRDKIHEDLIISEDIDDFIFNQLTKSNKVTKLKEKSNFLSWGGQLVCWLNDYYVVE